MIDKIESLIKEIKKQGELLKISIDDAKRDAYEYNLFYLNSEIGDYEQQYEQAQQELDDRYDKEFIKARPDVKSDKAAESLATQLLQQELTDMSIRKSRVKKYNREHRGMIRLGDYINGKKIQANFDTKNKPF